MVLIEIYENVKDVIAPAGQAGRSIAHIHLGLALFIGCSLIAPRRMAAAWPLLLLLLLEALNEMADLWESWPDVAVWRIRDTAADVVNTMFWPAVLFAVARMQERRAAAAGPGGPVEPAEAAPADPEFHPAAE